MEYDDLLDQRENKYPRNDLNQLNSKHTVHFILAKHCLTNVQHSVKHFRVVIGCEFSCCIPEVDIWFTQRISLN